MSIDFNKIHNFLSEYCERVKVKSSGRGFLGRCPVCGDSKKSSNTMRLHVDYYSQYDDYIAYCWNGGCEVKGTTITSLMSMVKGISYTQAKKELNEEVFDPKKIKDRLNNKKNIIEEEKVTKILDLDIEKDCLSISSTPESTINKRFHKALVDFVRDRKIPIDCYVAVSGRYKGRVIIPITINNELVYFQGRAISDEMTPKYLNPDVEKSNIILNIDKFDPDKSIIVTEGPIDSYMIENNQGTNALGSNISDDLLEVLFDSTERDIVLAYDNPNIDEAGKKCIMKMIEKGKYGKRVKYFLMPYNDIKDLNELVVKKNIDNVYDFVLKHSHSYLYVTTKFKLGLK